MTIGRFAIYDLWTGDLRKSRRMERNKLTEEKKNKA
jgi:hypothetical protein